MATGSNFVSKNTFYQCRSGKTSSGNFFDTPIEKSRVQKSWDIFSAMGCHATCWKLFQSFPLLELCEMTVIAFDVVYGFFDLYHVFTYYWIDSIADYNLARSTRIKCPHLRLFEKNLDLDNFSQKWQQVQRTLDIENFNRFKENKYTFTYTFFQKFCIDLMVKLVMLWTRGAEFFSWPLKKCAWFAIFKMIWHISLGQKRVGRLRALLSDEYRCGRILT